MTSSWSTAKTLFPDNVIFLSTGTTASAFWGGQYSTHNCDDDDDDDDDDAAANGSGMMAPFLFLTSLPDNRVPTQ